MKRVLMALIAWVMCVLAGCDVRMQMQHSAQMQSLERFYQLVMAKDVDGLPSKALMDELNPLISATLRDALLKAQDAEAQHALETQGTEAPLFDGPLFLGVSEGAQRIVKMVPAPVEGQVSYLVTLQVRGTQGKESTDYWTDRVVMGEDNGRWVIHDLVLRVKDVSTDEPSLTYSLRHADKCQDPQTQTDMNMCAANSHDMASTLLNETYKQLLQRLDKSRQVSLKQAQQAWLIFKDLQCAHEAAASKGGSIQSLVRSSCQTDLMQQRRQQLQLLLQEVN